MNHGVGEYGAGKYYNVEEVADLLAVTSQVIFDYLQKDDLKGTKLDNDSWKIELSDVKRFLFQLKKDTTKEAEFKQQQAIEVPDDWRLDKCCSCGEVKIISKEFHPFCSTGCQEAVNFCL
ncbi:helix-turn-helix domain-containing protein [Sporohalobacter salinus]|uniref:helix-turn-helix domain-containing protein n=1 Tax=Sporohalobacter salinus TaxID=1494606 RepID=UPI00195F3601|nr:helix-turn-helix domain-containing protein [Sporohalobacter salinus]MBM7624628.1 hypothetical protein [Sporohalobacter salinus]